MQLFNNDISRIYYTNNLGFENQVSGSYHISESYGMPIVPAFDSTHHGQLSDI